MKERTLAVALFAAAAVLWGGLLALSAGDAKAAFPVVLFAAGAAALTAGALGPVLRRRAVAAGEAAGGAWDGAGLTVLAYVLAVILVAAHHAATSAYGDYLGFLGVVFFGLIASIYFLPPALIVGGLAGFAFRVVVLRGVV